MTYEEQQARFREEADAQQELNNARRLQYEASSVGLTVPQLMKIREQGLVEDQQAAREREEAEAPQRISRKSKTKKKARAKAHARKHEAKRRHHR